MHAEFLLGNLVEDREGDGSLMELAQEDCVLWLVLKVSSSPPLVTSE
jgi:hypothetical protein